MTNRRDISKLTPSLLAELTSASAAPVAGTFAQFAGATLQPLEPVVADANAPIDVDAWTVGIFFDMEGGFGGPIGVLLSACTCEAVRAVLKDGYAGEPGPEVLDSMLLELGNVVASQTISAIADRLKGRIVLSIPHLVGEGAGRELSWRLRHRFLPEGRLSACRIEIEFLEPRGSRRALVVLAPDLTPTLAPSSGPFDNVE